MFPATFISGSCDFTLHFNFRCRARATFDKNLTNFAHAYILVMAWMGYARARLKTLSSLLKSFICTLGGALCLSFQFECVAFAKPIHVIVPQTLLVNRTMIQLTQRLTKNLQTLSFDKKTRTF